MSEESLNELRKHVTKEVGAAKHEIHKTIHKVGDEVGKGIDDVKKAVGGPQNIVLIVVGVIVALTLATWIFGHSSDTDSHQAPIVTAPAPSVFDDVKSEIEKVGDAIEEAL